MSIRLNKLQWPTTTLGSELKFISGGTPRKNEEKYWNGNIPWVSSGEMSHSRIYKTQLNVTEEGASNGTKLAPINTIFVVVRGMSLAKEFRISLAMREMTFNQDVKAIYPSKKIDPIFLFYYLKSQANPIRDSASEAAHGTKKLDMPVLEQWPLTLPPKIIQIKISAILTSYDDLIENNKRRIILLKNIAEEIYKEYFVRFRFPDYQNTEFEKGVPKGWEEKRIDSLGRVVTGKTPLTSNEKFYGGDIHFVKTPDMHGNMFINRTEERLTEDGLNSQPSQIIPENSISVSCIGTAGVVSITTQECSTNQQINSVSLSKKEDLEWAYFTFKALKQTILAFGATGATMTNLSKGKFAGIKPIVPPEDLRVAFHETVSPMFNEIKSLMRINNNLSETKNSLIPRLISGKLSVEDLDIQFPPSMLENKAN
jgi:type I restriction enzyme S subunit